MASRSLHHDLAALRAYVTAPGEAGGVQRAPNTVLLHVRHASLKARFAELRLDMHVSVRLCVCGGREEGRGGGRPRFFASDASGSRWGANQPRHPTPPTHHTHTR